MNGETKTGKIQSHQDLVVWQKGMDLATRVYALVKLFPTDERFRLVDQLVRAAVSVPANIAEGHARGSRKDFVHFLSIARGSLMETQTLIELAVRVGHLGQTAAAPVLALITEISKMLSVLRSRLLAPPPTPPLP